MPASTLVKAWLSGENAGMNQHRSHAAPSRRQTPASHFDVIIIGAGLAGLALAVALRGSGLRLALVEGRAAQFAQPDDEHWDARVYAISPANVRFLQDTGIWQHLPTAGPGNRLTPVQQMAIHGDGAGSLGFSAQDAAVEALAWIVESTVLQRELWETARRQGNVTLFCPARPATLSLQPEAALLTLADHQSLSASLIVAADGADSWTRQAAGIEVRFKPYQQHGVVANFSCQQPHRNIARQWFRQDGILAWLPLPGKRISMVWSTRPRHAQELLSLPGAELCQRVAAAGAFQLGELELITAPAAFPLRLMRAPHSVQARLALIGDAAHTLHPLSGHGINLGFQDAAVLARVLGEKPPHVECGELRLLRQYERARREEVVALQTLTHGLQRLFQAQDPLLSWLRNSGMNLTEQMPLLKNALVRYAMG